MKQTIIIVLIVVLGLGLVVLLSDRGDNFVVFDENDCRNFQEEAG